MINAGRSGAIVCRARRLFANRSRRGGFVDGKKVAETVLNDILRIGDVGARNGADIKALGGIIDLCDKPARHIAKKLEVWAINPGRASAEVAVTRGQLFM